MLKKILFSLWRSFAGVSKTFTLIFLVACGVFFGKLYVSPLQITSLAPRLSSYLEQKLPGWHVHFTTCELTWRPGNGGLVLDLGEAAVTPMDDNLHTHLTIKKLLFDFHLLRFLTHKENPYKLILVAPIFKYQETAAQEKPSDFDFLSYLPASEIREGQIDIQMGKNHWQATDLNMRCQRNANTLLLQGQAQLPTGHVTFETQAQMHQAQITALHFKVAAQGLQAKDLGHLWPEGLATPGRIWVAQNVLKGHIPHLEITGALQAQDEALSVSKLQGHVVLEGASVRYFPELPEAEGVNAEVQFDQERVIIDLKKGSCGGMTVQDGQVEIRDFAALAPVLEVGLRVIGPLEKGLPFILQKPFDLLAPLKAYFVQATGNAQVQLKITLPLQDSLAPKDVRVSGEAYLQDVQLPYLLKDLTSTPRVASPNLHVVLTPETVTVRGDAQALAETSHVTWSHHFATNKSTCDLKGTYAGTTLAKLRLGLPPLYRGRCPVALQIQQKDGNLTEISTQADLTTADLALPGLGTLSPAGRTCKADLHLVFPQHKPLIVQMLKLSGQDIDIQIHPGKSLGHYICPRARWRDTDISIKANLARDMPSLSLSGKRLVIYPDDAAFSQTGSPLETNLDLVLDLDMLEIFSRGTLHNVHTHYIQKNGHITKAYLTAQQESKRVLLRATMTPQDAIIVSSEDAGFLFKLLNITNIVKGGTLTAKIHQRAKSGFDARVLIENCYVAATSPLARLIGHASPVGLIDAMQGKDISLSKVKAHLYREGNHTVVKTGAATGHTIGFTFQGVVSPQDIKIYGTMMPMNFINQLVSWVPLIGEFFREGIVGLTYRMTGAPDNPQLSFNPLSALAPGAFKAIFAKKNWMIMPTDTAEESADE